MDKIPERVLRNYGLLCLKPVYGLNDAPLAWQLSLRDFIRESGAEPSHLDENCWTWKKDGEDTAMVTTHVDDLAITGTHEWLDNANDSFVKKFGKVTRRQLPFTHCGCEYLRTADGYMISQQEFSEKITPAPVLAREDDARLTPAEVSDLRSFLGALLWVTATRLDVIADVSALQSRVTVAEVKDLKQANNVLMKVKEFADVGLRYRYFRTKHRRLVCFHDASPGIAPGSFFSFTTTFSFSKSTGRTASGLCSTQGPAIQSLARSRASSRAEHQRKWQRWKKRQRSTRLRYQTRQICAQGACGYVHVKHVLYT